MRRILAVATGAVLASGCLLTTSLDELSMGSAAATTDGGGTDSRAGDDGTAPPTDAPPGADVTEASDAPSDTTGGDVSTTTYCTGKTATFCEDFDREPFSSAWSTDINPGGGCFAERRTTMSPFSPPKGLLASCKASAAGSTMGQAIIRRYPGQLGASVTVSCMVRVDQVGGASEYSNGMTVIIRGGGKEVYAQLGYDAAGPSSVRLFVEKYGGDDGTAVVGTMPRGEWRRIDLKVEEPDATHGHVTITQGASSATLDVMTSVWPPAGSRGLEVALGVYYTETAGTTIAYDDCTIEKN